MPVYGLPTALESSLNSLLEHSRPASWRVSGHGDDVTVVLRWAFCGSATSEKTLDYDEFTPMPETSQQRAWCEREGETNSRAIHDVRDSWQGEGGQTRAVVNGSRSAKKDWYFQSSRMRRKYEPYPSTVTATAKASAAAAATTAITTASASNRSVSPISLFVTNSAGGLHGTSSEEAASQTCKPNSVSPHQASKKQRQRTHSEELRQIALLQRTPFRHHHHNNNNSVTGEDAFGDTPDTKAMSPFTASETTSSLITVQQYMQNPRLSGSTPRSCLAIEKKSPGHFTRQAPLESPPKLSPLTDDVNDNRDNSNEEINDPKQSRNLVERHSDDDKYDDKYEDSERRKDVQPRLHDRVAATHSSRGTPESRTVASASHGSPSHGSSSQGLPSHRSPCQGSPSQRSPSQRSPSHRSPSHRTPSRESPPHDLEMACCSSDQDQCRIYVNSDATSLSWDSFESGPDSGASDVQGTETEPGTREKCE